MVVDRHSMDNKEIISFPPTPKHKDRHQHRCHDGRVEEYIFLNPKGWIRCRDLSEREAKEEGILISDPVITQSAFDEVEDLRMRVQWLVDNWPEPLEDKGITFPDGVIIYRTREDG